MANKNNYSRYLEIEKLQLIEPARLHLHAGLIVYVHFHVDQVLEILTNYHYMEKIPTII